MLGTEYSIEHVIAADRHVAIVVAHQDDESIAFCSILRACPNALVVHVTDGAPDDSSEWKNQPSREAYAALRAQEVQNALGIVKHVGPRMPLNIRDTRAPWHIRDIICALITAFGKHQTRYALTHAFEGGHPDHDAVAYAVHVAARRSSLRVVEAPLYRMTPDGRVWQSFAAHPDSRECVVRLNEEDRRVKERMLLAHASQSEACAQADTSTERFRTAPDYDFTELPGHLSRNYSRAGIDKARWREIITAAGG